MRKSLRTSFLGVAAIAAIAAPLAFATAANADTPDGTYDIVPVASAHASAIGAQSSQIKQNGQFVSGKWTDLEGWQNQHGDRGEIVQDALGH